jgi:isopentenyl-diphosphate delta-isomerase
MKEYVVLVDENDIEVGVCEKIESHRLGLRHRAFSVILMQGEKVLLQRRSDEKYHSAGLWANAACGHPRPDEDMSLAAHRRLAEEMGITCPLTWKATTQYTAEVGTNMIENEIVHLYFGEYNGPVTPDPAEASDWMWYDRRTLCSEIEDSHRYAYWLKDYFRKQLI